MTLVSLLTTAALFAAVALLWLAAIRLASLTSPRGLGRALSAVTLVAAAAVLQALGLGLGGLGTSPPALLVASIAIWLAAARLLPAPDLGPGRELLAWWRGLSTPWRLAAGGAAGIAGAWAIQWLLVPALDIDTTVYHLSQPAIWVQDGHPGSVHLVDVRYPVGNYPLTNEVLISWVAGLSRSMGAALLWGPFTGLLLLLATVAAARWAGASRAQSALAAVALVTIPTVADSVTSLDSDLGSAAWSAVAIALAVRAAGAREEPGLLCYSILACGLAIGTKTSVAIVCLFALGAAAYVMRPRLPRPRDLLLATAGALAVGGVWYARNLLDHGSPLWPFVAAPWGDPSPESLGNHDTSFLAHAGTTLDGYVRVYFDAFGLAPLILLAAAALPLATRDRRLRLAGAGVAISALAWAAVPYTGSLGDPFTTLLAISTLRYLIATLAAAAIVLAVLASRRGPAARLALVALLLAAAWGVIAIAFLRSGASAGWTLLSGEEGVPPAHVLLLGGVAGLAAAAMVGAARRPRGPAVAVAVATALAIATLALYPASFLDRYGTQDLDADQRFGDTRRTYGTLAAWFDGEPAYRDGDAPVLFAAGVVGPLAGGRFEHPIGFAQPGTPCPELQARREDGWVVVPAPAQAPAPPFAACFPGEEPAADLPMADGGRILVFGGG